MKIGFYSESRADQAALAVFTEGILGGAVEPLANMDLEGRGATSLMKALDGVLRGLYFNSDAEGLVVVVDCDDTEMHSEAHDADNRSADRCRYCNIRTTITRARNQMRKVGGRPELKVANWSCRSFN